ncbi:MAG: DUF2249 domain-containing protein [Acidobacteria bacterium]|nr:DUF2249 domain-containing protein [Acidobacteriota bacterium]
MPEKTPALDVRSLPPVRRHAEIFRAFDALEPGAAFVLVNDHYPKPLLYQFQMEHPGQFEWNVLETGPDRHRVEIERRKGSPSRTVTDYLEADHRRLDRILENVRRQARGGALEGAAGSFGEFSTGLNRHIDAEEDVLFPAFEQLTGVTEGPTTAMRFEHVEIRRLLGEVASALAAGHAERATASIGELHGVLAAHNMKEEGVLYPVTDEAAGSARAVDDLVRRMQAI